MTSEANNKLSLDKLEEFGNEISRSRGFDAGFMKFNANTGEWTAGKNATSMNARKLVADLFDLMKGHQRFQDRRPIYALVRVADGISPPGRDQLGDTDSLLWVRDEGDPWKFVAALPFFDPETRETFIYITSTDGGTRAIGSLVKAFTAEHRERPGKLPLVELDSDSYRNTRGGRTFVPIFDIVGWVDRPAAVKRSLPPPLPPLSVGRLPIITVNPEVSPGINEPPPYSDDELNRLAQEGDERAGGVDDQL